MTQNASVETVAARMYKTEKSDFMLRTRRGISIIVAVKERASIRDRSYKGMATDCRTWGFREPAMRTGPRGKGRFEGERESDPHRERCRPADLYAPILKRRVRADYTRLLTSNAVTMTVDGRPSNPWQTGKNYAETFPSLDHSLLGRKAGNANPFDHPRLPVSPSTETSKMIPFDAASP